MVKYYSSLSGDPPRLISDTKHGSYTNSMFDLLLERTIVSAHIHSGGLSIVLKVTAHQIIYIYQTLSELLGDCTTPDNNKRPFTFVIGTESSDADHTYVYEHCSLQSIVTQMGMMTMWFGYTSQKTAHTTLEELRYHKGEQSNEM